MYSTEQSSVVFIRIIRVLHCRERFGAFPVLLMFHALPPRLLSLLGAVDSVLAVRHVMAFRL